MHLQSVRGSGSFESVRDYYFPMPSTTESPQGSTHELHPVDNTEGSEIRPSWRALFFFTTRKHIGPIITALIVTCLSALTKPAAAIFFGKIFSSLAAFGGGKISSQQALHDIAKWCIGLVGLGGAVWVVEGCFIASWMVYGELQAKSVREKMFTGMLDKDMAWYDTREDGIGSLLIRIQTQIRELQLAVSQPMGFLGYEIFAMMAALGLAFYYSWKLTVVIVSTFPIAAIVLYFVSMQLGPAIEVQKRELSRASKFANTAVVAINTVKAYNGQDQEVWQYYSTIKRVAAAYLIQVRSNAMQHGITKFVMVGLFVQGFWYGLVLVNQGMDPGHVLTTFYACLNAMQAVEIVLPQWLVLAKGMSAGQTLRTIMIQMQHGRKISTMVGTVKPESCPGDIEINAVSFAYPSNPQQDVLSEVNVFFPSGETTFVVGTSGSGKSTLGNLLMKYYEAHRGDILIDGKAIQTLDSDWLRQNITLVQQQSVLFNETIAQNIAFGRKETASPEEIHSACRAADLEVTLQELPDGLNTMTGPSGNSLSGGQQQRVAMARARLRDAPVLILDESTSALDSASRDKVVKSIREWRQGKTTIIITHDVSQIQEKEYVYVLEFGKVVQEGYYGDLAKKEYGTFATFLPNFQENEIQSNPPRRHSEPSSPTTASTEGWNELATPKWGVVSHLFGMNEASSHVFNRGGIGNRGSMILGVGAAHAYDLRAQNIWSSPVIPDEDRKFPEFQPTFPQRPATSYAPPRMAHFEEIDSQVSILGISTPMRQTRFAAPSATPPNGLSQQELLRPRTLILDTTVTRHDPPTPPAPPRPRSQPHGDDPLVDKEQPVPKPRRRKPAAMTKIFGTVWPILNRKQRCVLVFGFCSAFTVSCCTPAFSYIFTQLLQVYYRPSDREAEARKWAVYLLIIAIVDGTSVFCTHYSLEYSGQVWVNSLRVEALKRILAQPRSWFDKEKNSASKLNESLDRNAEEMRNLIGRFAGPIFITFWMLTSSIIWSLIISWRLTLVAMACAPVMYLMVELFNWTSGRWETRSNEAAEKASGIFSETFTNIRVVRALTLESHFMRKYDKVTLETYKTGLFRAFYSSLLFGLGDTMSFIITAIVFYYGTVITTKGTLTVSSILQVVNLLLFGIANAMSTLNMVPQMNTARATATRMLYLANLPLKGSHESVGTRRLYTPFPIKFADLSFTYPDRRPQKTLHKINLTLTAGSCTAIVGSSGSGKSTLASILQGLYTPNTPSLTHPAPLTFCNVPIQDCNLKSLRSFISVVAQQPLLFPTTILANIIYGLPEGSPFANLNSAMQAAEDAGIHEFIMSLGNGYNTYVGDGGQGLSGGQAQRIALARALVRHPKLLILDEATSALDAVSAVAVRETVRKLMQRARESGEGGTATVIISHSTEMMRVADEIVVLEEGTIVERGSFEELRRRGGAFCRVIGEGDREIGKAVERRVMTPVRGRSRDSWVRKGSVW